MNQMKKVGWDTEATHPLAVSAEHRGPSLLHQEIGQGRSELC